MNPSISSSNTLIRRGATSSDVYESRFLPIESISSKKRTQGAFFLAIANTSERFFSDSPYHSERRSEHFM